MCDEDRAAASRPAGGMQGDEMTKTVADSVHEWEHAGMRCVRRCGILGAPCGYVEVPEGHPLYGVEFWDMACEPDVYGGVTYTGDLGVDGAWFVGFDMAHYGDFRTGDECERETERLAEQLRDWSEDD